MLFDRVHKGILHTGLMSGQMLSNSTGRNAMFLALKTYFSDKAKSCDHKM